MTNKTLTARTAGWGTLNAVFVILIIGFYTLCLAVPTRWAALYETYGRALIITMAALYFWNMRLRGCFEVRVMLFYAAWLFVTRLLNGDTYLQNEYDLVLAELLCFLVLASAFTMGADTREKFFDAVIVLYCGVFFIASLLGLFCCIMGCYLVFPPEGVIFGIDREIEYLFTNFVGMFTTIRNISAVWTFTAWCLALYEFVNKKSLLWRIPFGIALFVFTLAVMMSYTRTITVSFCVCCAMLAILIVLKKTKGRHILRRFVLCAVCAACALGISYKATNAVKPLLGAVSSVVTSDLPRESNDIIHYHGKVSEDFTVTRTSSASASSLSGRTDIYRAALTVLKNEPSTLLRGKYSFKIKTSLAPFFPSREEYPVMHTHNFLLQTALLTGIIGLAAVVIFTVCVTLRMIVFFFSENGRVRFADKLLTLPITGLLLYSMMEIMIFTNCSDERSFGTDLRELMFFLITGIFLAKYYEAFPSSHLFKFRNKIIEKEIGNE